MTPFDTAGSIGNRQRYHLTHWDHIYYLNHLFPVSPRRRTSHVQ